MNIKRLNDKVYRVGIPVPFPMKYVYCYLMENEFGYTLIDTGFHYKKAVEAWEETFEELQVDTNRIHTIFLTHFHPDHSGLAGWMQQRTGARVWMSSDDLEMFQLAFKDNGVQKENVEKLIYDHGVPAKLRDEIQTNLQKMSKHVQPFVDINPITEKECKLDDRTWEIIQTPGHSKGHLCFYQKEEKILIAGDMILDPITPNISLWPGGSEYPLHDYFNSLEKLMDYSVEQVWPGHGDIIYHVTERIEELMHHHYSRLDKISSLATSKSTFEIADALFAGRQLNAHQWRFAISETLAHLEYLADERKISRIQSTPILYANSL
ncbi:MBL fold metallo-hydrolase [Aquibacillus sp. 3ASR75-11]|uniref:MBL fold metallo-hydrolase n=1 Tax=Terrihalobacillus insolitus TaxID=2950438 RepID=A0A9X3WVA2_9BACI|nr:MBL fold metallo-hydrolase [Terrihalobacillus insolitus]MDC3415164.1 MBL fold metallo-hydrolase [Terrihalobacillus insolitus]MDC3424064.1 MBL fold metallo-hydrolase [Terrihalobacillus insolitus]